MARLRGCEGKAGEWARESWGGRQREAVANQRGWIRTQVSASLRIWPFLKPILQKHTVEKQRALTRSLRRIHEEADAGAGFSQRRRGPGRAGGPTAFPSAPREPRSRPQEPAPQPGGWPPRQPAAGGTLTRVLLRPVPRPQLPQLRRGEVAGSPGPRGQVRELGKLVDGDPLVFNKACKARKDVKYGLKRKLGNLNFPP